MLLLSTRSLDPTSGRSPIFPFVVHQPVSPSIWQPVGSLQRGLSASPRVTTWCICECSWRDDVCRVCGCDRGGIVMMDVIWHRLCVSMILGRVIDFSGDGRWYDEWCGGSISSELLMYVGGVRSIVLLPCVTIDVCIWCMLVYMSVVVVVWGL